MSSLITIDKKYPECTGINTHAWLNATCGETHDEDWLEFLQQLNEQHNEEMRRDPNQDFFGYVCERSPYTNRWISQLQDEIGMYLRAKTGQVYVPAHDIGNTYNDENDFCTTFQYQVWVPIDEARWHEKANQWFCDEFYYRDDCFVVTEMHMGGDVRGNYGVPEIRGPVDNLCDAHFLDWMVGWYVGVYRKEHGMFYNADEDGEFTSGYHQNPTYHLLEQLKGNKMLWSEKHRCFVGWLNGRAVKMHPQCDAEYN